MPAAADQILSWAAHLLAAALLALPTAWDREARSRNAGLRTFPLVAMGSCGYILIGQSFIAPDAPDAMARIMQGLLSGIGFVGGGAILKHEHHVTGIASAASIWIMGGLGASVAFGLWGLAVLLSVFNFLIIFVLSRLKTEIGGGPERSG